VEQHYCEITICEVLRMFTVLELTKGMERGNGYCACTVTGCPGLLFPFGHVVVTVKRLGLIPS
jgi:hypothetical protein